jgi:hypothetical protein
MHKEIAGMVFSLGNPNCLNAGRYSNAGTEE